MSALSRVLLPSRHWLLPVVLALIASPAMAADKITMRVEVFGMGGMHVATDRTTIEETGNTYTITGDLKTTGLAGMFQEFQSHSTARGRLAGTGAQPEAYAADVRRDSGERHDKVDFRAAATASGSSTLQGKAGGGAAPPTSNSRSEAEPLQRLRQIGEAVEQRGGIERRRVGPGIAVPHQHQGQPGAVRRGGVVLVVADHRGALGLAAKLGDQPQEMTG